MVCCTLIVAAIGGLAWRRGVRRRRRGRDIFDDTDYLETLATLSQGSVRRSFQAYRDIDWDHPDLSVGHHDPRWILPRTDPLGRHPWYLAQTPARQIEIGLYRQANIEIGRAHV